MSMELWKEIFDWSAVVLVGLTFAAGAGALITGKILSERQAEQLRHFDSELTIAKGALADQEQKAADAKTAQQRVEAELQRSIAESRSKATELAKVQKEAAEAQLTLERTVELAAHPRRIIFGNRSGDEKIRSAKFKELEKYATTPAAVVFVRDEEAEILAYDIGRALTQSGWKSVAVIPRASTPIPLGYIEEGVQVRTLSRVDSTSHVSSFPPLGFEPKATPACKALLELLDMDLGKEATGSPFGVRWQPEGVINGKPFGGVRQYGFQFPDDGLVITIGSKPTWQAFWFLPKPTRDIKNRPTGKGKLGHYPAVTVRDSAPKVICSTDL